MKKQLILPILAGAVLISGVALASSNYGNNNNNNDHGDKPQTTLICKQNEDGAWQVTSVDKGTTLTGTEYAYAGPVDKDGQPSKDGDDWCKTNVPVPPVVTPPVVTTTTTTTPVTPAATPTQLPDTGPSM